MPDDDERVPMTTPDPSKRGADGDQSAWGAVARLLSVQLLAVVAVTAVITGIYALAGGHGDNKVTAASTTKDVTASTAPTSPAASTPPASTPAASPSASPAPAASTTPTPEAAARLKVDVLNQSGPGGIAATTATRVRALGWTVGRVDDFRGNVSKTTVYYPKGEAPAARELARALPGKPRVLPRFSTLAEKRLTLIIVG